MGIWTLGGLIGDFGVVILLEKVSGLAYLRWNGLSTLAILAAFLLVPDLGVKVALAGGLGLSIGGRYAILEAQLYAAVPGRTASVRALSNIANSIGGLFPTLIGIAAAAWGLGSAMWLLMIGPLAVSIGTWRAVQPRDRSD